MHNSVKIFVCDFQCRFFHIDSGIIDQHINRAVRGFYRFHQSIQQGPFGHIVDHVMHPVAEGVGGFPQGFFPPTRDDDAGSGLHHAPGNIEANAAASARNES